MLILLTGAHSLAQPAVPEEIASAAVSPFELDKYVQSNSDFDWAPLWSALHIENKGIFLPRCEQVLQGDDPCSSELINITHPPQVIVLLEHKISGFQVFLRYESLGDAKWRFAGAFAPVVKYFPAKHRVARFGAKPFLIVTGQGNAGTGLSSKLEDWIDLTRAASSQF